MTTTAQRNRPFILDVGEQQFLANIGRVAAPSLVGGGAGGGVDGEGKDYEEKRELDSCEKSTLEPYIPKEDLDSAVLHDGKVPFYLANRFDAITRGNHIYVRPNAYDPSVPAGLALLGHELEHVGQYRGGMTVFSYWQSTLGPDGYDGSPYEIAAYATQLRIGNDLTKNGFAGCPQGADLLGGAPSQWALRAKPVAVLVGGLVLFGLGDWSLIASGSATRRGRCCRAASIVTCRSASASASAPCSR